jgi:hypothetical protein
MTTTAGAMGPPLLYSTALRHVRCPCVRRSMTRQPQQYVDEETDPTEKQVCF